MSFVAMILMAWRRVENWYLWICVDVVDIWLYGAKEVWLLSAVYVLFLALAVKGLRRWRTHGRRGQRAAAPSMTRGVVIGKFDPPHRGHLHLIRTALAGADEVTVIVCERADQPLPGALRAAWLREMAPAGARDRRRGRRCTPDDSRAWAERTREVLGYAPELVFTSERYGDAYARLLGARHVLVDLERRAVPVSATHDPARPAGALGAPRAVRPGALRAPGLRAGRRVERHDDARPRPRGALPHGVGAGVRPGVLRGQAAPARAAALGRGGVRVHRRRAESPRGRPRAPLRAAARLRHRRVRDPALAGALPGAHHPGGRARRARAGGWTSTCSTDCGIPFVQDGTRDGEHLRGAMQRRFEQELRARPASPSCWSRGRRRSASRKRWRRAMRCCVRF